MKLKNANRSTNLKLKYTMRTLLLFCCFLPFVVNAQGDTSVPIFKVSSDAPLLSFDKLHTSGKVREGMYVYAINKSEERYRRLVKVVTDSAIGYTFPGILGMSVDEFNEIDSMNEASKLDYAIRNRPGLVKLQKRLSSQNVKAAEAQAKQTDAFIRKIQQAGVLVTLRTNVGDYSAGFIARVLNPSSSKTIKYVWITTKAINPVHDIVGTKTVRAVGPIEPLQRGEYEFENVYFSRVVESIALTKLLVEYMDGTKKTITGDMLFEFTR